MPPLHCVCVKLLALSIFNQQHIFTMYSIGGELSEFSILDGNSVTDEIYFWKFYDACKPPPKVRDCGEINIMWKFCIKG